jgi:hypothetical protein
MGILVFLEQKTRFQADDETGFLILQGNGYAIMPYLALNLFAEQNPVS